MRGTAVQAGVRKWRSQTYIAFDVCCILILALPGATVLIWCSSQPIVWQRSLCS